MHFNVDRFIPESKLKAFLVVLGWLCKYNFSSADWDAIEPALPKTDSEAEQWFDYTFYGESTANIRVGLEVGCAMVNIKLNISPALESQACAGNGDFRLLRCFRPTLAITRKLEC